MAAPRDLSIRPLSLGEVIDRAVALTLRHFGVLFPAMLVIQVPVLALYRSYAIELERAYVAVLAHPGGWAAASSTLGTAWLAMVAVLLLLQLLATSAAAAIVAPSLQGREAPEPGAAARTLLRRARSTITAAVAQMIALGVALLAGALPGLALAVWAGRALRLPGIALALLGSLLALLAAALRLALAPAVAGVEGLAGVRALIRSARLMAPRPGTPLYERPGLRVSILLLATFLLAATVGGIVGLPRALTALALHRGGPAPIGPLPLGLEIGLGIFEGVANSAIQPFSLVALAVFYFDRRARAEGLDLELWADRLPPEVVS